MNTSELILVADDDPDLRSMVSQHLARAGFAVVTGRDGQEAVERFRSERPAVSVLDVVMPGLDGLAALRQIRALDGEAEVIVLTGDTSAEAATLALRLGAFDYMEKPLEDIDSLSIMIERALEQRRLRMDNARLAAALETRETRLLRVGRLLNSLTSDLSLDMVLDRLAEESAGLLGVKRAFFSLDDAGDGAHPEGRVTAEDSARVILSLPLAAPDQQRFGSLNFLDDPLRQFDPSECALAQILADQASVALNRHSLECRLGELAWTDPLTQLLGRKAFYELAARELGRAQRHNRLVSLVVWDVEGLRTINQGFGRGAGDAVLQSIGAMTARVFRHTDITARYGEDDFAALLPECDFYAASEACTRLRAALDRLNFEAHHRAFQVKVNAAVIEWRPDEPCDLHHLLRLAESVRNHSKGTGGGQPTVANVD